MYNELLLMSLLSHNHFGYNPEYENLSDEEKAYMDYCEKCLNERDEKFSNACTLIMLFILEVSSKMDTPEELTSEEINLRKQELLSSFSEEDKQRLESFMYATIQTMGIYSEESIKLRKTKKERK